MSKSRRSKSSRHLEGESDLEGLDDNYEPRRKHDFADDLDADEREIRHLEKLLGLNKRWKRKKSSGGDNNSSSRKKLPTSFKDMGLDYLLKPILKSDTFYSSRSKVEENMETSRKRKSANVSKEPVSKKGAPEATKRSLYTEDAESGDDSNDSGEESNEEDTDSGSDERNGKPVVLTDDSQRLARRAMALMNRLSEATVTPLFNEARGLYRSNEFSRAGISNALCNAALATCVVKPAFVVPDKVSSPVAIFFALLRVTGCATDAVGQLIHRLTWLLVEYGNSDEAVAKQQRETPKLENTVKLLSHLLLFRSLDSVLLLDVLRMFSSHISQTKDDSFYIDKAEYAASLTISLLRTAGPALRKNDPSGLAAAIREVQDAASNACSQGKVSSGSRLRFLAEVIAAVRNNNFAKIPGYNAEESSRFAKLFSRLKADLSANESKDDSPFRVSLSALASFGESGSNWWLKADTCSGPMALVGNFSNQSDKKVKQHQPTAVDKEHKQLAQKLHLNTELRRSIFSVLISSADIEDAVERVLKMPLRSELQRTEVVPVAFQCCLKERKYNPFYGQLLSRLCSQETDKKQRLFRLAVKKSFTERLAMVTESPIAITNTAKICVDLIRLNAISFITATNCVDFTAAAPGSPSYAFLHALLDTFFHPSKLDELAFRRIIVEPLVSAQKKGVRKVASALLLFAKHMYDSGKKVAVASTEDEEDEDDEETAKKQPKKFIKGYGKYTLDDLRPRLVLLSAEIV